MKEIKEIAALEEQIAVLGDSVEDLESMGAEIPKSLIEQIEAIKEKVHRLHLRVVLRYCLVAN